MFYSEKESLFTEMQAQSMRKSKKWIPDPQRPAPPPAMPSLSSAWFLTMTARQPGLKKFTPTVQSRTSCWRCRSSFQHWLHVAPRPCTEKEWEPHWKWRKYPREEHPNRDKREPLISPLPRTGQGTATVSMVPKASYPGLMSLFFLKGSWNDT